MSGGAISHRRIYDKLYGEEEYYKQLREEGAGDNRYKYREQIRETDGLPVDFISAVLRSCSTDEGAEVLAATRRELSSETARVVSQAALVLACLTREYLDTPTPELPHVFERTFSPGELMEIGADDRYKILD